MSVEEARRVYLVWAEAVVDLPNFHCDANPSTDGCPTCAYASEQADAASISLDLANAEAARAARGAAV